MMEKRKEKNEQRMASGFIKLAKFVSKKDEQAVNIGNVPVAPRLRWIEVIEILDILR